MSSKARKALLRVADRLGYEWRRHGRHIVLEHPETHAVREVPYDVPEAKYGNNWRNYVSTLRQGAGQSTQGAVHVEGQRRTKRRPTGEAARRIGTRAARRAAVIAGASSRAVERRELELADIRRLMH